MTAFERGYSCPLWLTFQQAKELGGYVKKGEKGTTVVYANTFEKKETDAETGEETTERIPFLRSYTVFNAVQVEGLPGHYYALADAPRNLTERLQHADEFFDHTKAETRHGGNLAFYRPSDDFIQLPPYESFTNRESYYSTRTHESIHWTKHESRVNRSFDSKRFGDARSRRGLRGGMRRRGCGIGKAEATIDATARHNELWPHHASPPRNSNSSTNSLGSGPRSSPGGPSATTGPDSMSISGPSSRSPPPPPTD